MQISTSWCSSATLERHIFRSLASRKEPSLTPNFTQPIYLYSTVLTGGIVIDGSLLDEIRCPLLTYLCS